MEFFELQSGTAGVVQYQLSSRTSRSPRPPRRRPRPGPTPASPAGREYIRQLVADDPTALDAWDFSSKLGLLVAKEPDVANVPADVADAADGQAPVGHQHGADGRRRRLPRRSRKHPGTRLPRRMALKLITAGESHGPGLTTIVEGLPAGLELDQEAIDRDMARRQLGHGRGGRMKIETRPRATSPPASATAARSAARSRCRSPTATTPTGRSG